MFQGRAARLLKHCQIVHERPMGSRSITRWYSADRTVQLGDHDESSVSFSPSPSSPYSPRPNTTPGRITTTALMPCPSHTIPIHSLHLVITLPSPQCSHPQPPRPLVLPPRRLLSRVWTATAPPRRGRSTAWLTASAATRVPHAAGPAVDESPRPSSNGRILCDAVYGPRGRCSRFLCGT